MTDKITSEFIETNINEILENLRPDIMFEFFSKKSNDWLNQNGWNIIINDNENKMMGNYQNGKLVSGKWFTEHEIEKNMNKLHEVLKPQANKLKVKFSTYLNQLLCKGKANGGISWNEYDAIINIERGN